MRPIHLYSPEAAAYHEANWNNIYEKETQKNIITVTPHKFKRALKLQWRGVTTNREDFLLSYCGNIQCGPPKSKPL